MGLVFRTGPHVEVFALDDMRKNPPGQLVNRSVQVFGYFLEPIEVPLAEMNENAFAYFCFALFFYHLRFQ